MKKYGLVFTEILVGFIVVAILASVAMTIYLSTVENNERLLCESRQKLIYTAVKMYIADYGVVPASLSWAWPEYKDKALAQLKEENRKAGFSLTRYWMLIQAAQASEVSKYYGDDISVITCPRDDSPPPGGISYSFNSIFINQSAAFFKNNPNAVLIYESDTESGEVSYRHKKGLLKVSNYITAAGQTKMWDINSGPSHPAYYQGTMPRPHYPNDTKGKKKY